MYLNSVNPKRTFQKEALLRISSVVSKTDFTFLTPLSSRMRTKRSLPSVDHAFSTLSSAKRSDSFLNVGTVRSSTTMNFLMPFPLSTPVGAGMLSLLFLRMASLSWRYHSLMMIGGGLITPSLSVGLPTLNRSSMTLLTTGTEEVSPLALAATRISLRIRS